MASSIQILQHQFIVNLHRQTRTSQIETLARAFSYRSVGDFATVWKKEILLTTFYFDDSNEIKLLSYTNSTLKNSDL